jgi:hypothetical protein
MLVETVEKLPPAAVVVDDAAQRVEKKAPLKYWSWGGSPFTPRAVMIGSWFLTLDLYPFRYRKLSSRP